jgi:competence protein ComEA
LLTWKNPDIKPEAGMSGSRRGGEQELKQHKPVRRSVKIAVFILLVGLSALFSLLAKIIFPGVDASSIVMSSGSDPAASAVSSTETTLAPSSAPDLIPVYLVGAVKSPGIYLVIRGSYLFELVDRAGGLTSDAAIKEINLAYRLDDNQRILLPTLKEAITGLTGPALSSLTKPRLVNLNQAGQSELENLPGVRPATARAILDYRGKHGRFSQVTDLMKVPGIKESRFEALKDLVCVTGG